jgi:diketogulonate reductase-like aldo/keto reductase
MRPGMIERPIPSTGELLPVIGLGTWQAFDVAGPEPLQPVIEAFVQGGARLIDTSPMYGRAEAILGALCPPGAFIATKVWTQGREAGIEQMERSMRLLRVTGALDLMQIHNLVDWKTHLETLRRWKAEGRVRYIGVTHYLTAELDRLAAILRKEKVDFVQLPLSAGVPDAERILPMAREHGVAVIANRPLEEGALLRRFRGQPLPAWAVERGIASWAELFLRWIVSHPEVTCVIPATSRREHMEANLRAGEGALLTAAEMAKTAAGCAGDGW